MKEWSMADGTYDVIVVGAGPGGLACSARLAHRGMRVLLVERSDHVGGKAVAGERDGFRYELGPKLQVPAQGPAFAELFAELGISDKLRQITLNGVVQAYRPAGETEYRMNISKGDQSSDGSDQFDLWGLDDDERRRATEIMGEMVSLTGPQLDELDDVSMQQYLERFPDIPFALWNYMGLHSNASLAEPFDRVAASEQIKILQQLAFQGGAAYYEGGFGRMLDDLAAAFVGLGGEVRTGVAVERIDIADGHVTGVTTPAGTFAAAAVVSDAGIQPTVLKLAGAEHFPDEYVEYVRNLEPGWGWASIRYFLSRKVLDASMAMIYSDDTWYTTERYDRLRHGEWDDDVIVFLTIPGNLDPSMAPPGKQCIVSGSICSPDPEAAEIEEIYRRIDATIGKIFPEVMEAVEHRVTEGPREVSRHTRDSAVPGAGGECVGIGQIVGQCGTKKPSPITPVQGLYVCGADAGYEGMGTHQACGSGMRVAAVVQERLAQAAH
jgi:prolycopene isomerase